jgi:2',3'-cyclic-nucleotide 2'-phosphodiesterase (5'-nucleotidase family)
MESGSNSKYLGKVVYHLNDTYDLSHYNAQNINNLTNHSPKIDEIIDSYLDEVKEVFQHTIIQNGAYLNRADLTDWIAKLIRYQTGSVIAFHNLGGTRYYNIPANSNLTLELLYKIMPFDNVVKTVKLTGAQIKKYVSDKATGSNPYVGYSLNEIYTDVSKLIDSQLYLVATSDYVFDKEDDIFVTGSEINYEGSFLRDLMLEELILQKESGKTKFYLTDPTLIGTKTPR